MKFYFYENEKEILTRSHLKDETFFSLADSDIEADFLFVGVSEHNKFLSLCKNNSTLLTKKIVYYNFTEPISFGNAKDFINRYKKLGGDSKNILLHSTNHFLDQFNCLHKGLSITDHIVKSRLYGFVPMKERFLKFSFINNSIRKPRALVLENILNRNLFLNHCYVTANGDFHYGDKHIKRIDKLSEYNEILKSSDADDVYTNIGYDSELTFQSVFKNSFFGFTIDTFADFGLDNKGYSSHLTEKTLRNFAFKIPFLLLISSEEQIRIIEDLGFKSYNDLFNFKIDVNNVEKTINDYSDIIEKFSKMTTQEVKRFSLTKEVNDIIEHNHSQMEYYTKLNIENIYRYILDNSYDNKNDLILDMNEPIGEINLNILTTNL
jgi:hypothetical protein